MYVVQHKVTLVATARQQHGGRWLSTGDLFEASPAEAEDLIALNFARRAAPPQVALLDSKVLESESSSSVTTPVDRVRRTYRRRDMKAEK